MKFLNLKTNHRHSLYLWTALITMVTASTMEIFTHNSNIALAITPITVDPYNDSGFEAIPVEPQVSNNNYNTNNQFLNIQNNGNDYSLGEIFINGNATPVPPSVTSTNLVKSNQSLPQIPSLGEPYRQSQESQYTQSNPDFPENSSPLSVSSSPLDQTPEDNQPSLSQPRTISTSGNINNTTNRTNINSQNSSTTNILNNSDSGQTIPNQQNTNKRRTLNDILVFSAPPTNNATIENPNNPISSVKTNPNNLHKVLVKIANSTQESQVKSLYPDAFKTNFKGKTMLQVGVFSSVEKAQEVSEMLKSNGFQIEIIN